MAADRCHVFTCFDLDSNLDSNRDSVPSGGSPFAAIVRIGAQWSIHAPWSNKSTLRVRFLTGDPALTAKIFEIAKEWTHFANINFELVTSGFAEIRVLIDDSGASHSYVGNVALGVPQSEPTMVFGWFTPNTPEDELRRTTLHEFGHALGLLHEHQSPNSPIQWNRSAVYDAFRGRLGGPELTEEGYRRMVDINVLSSVPASSVLASQFDPHSIMMYPIDASLTLNGYSTPLNTRLSATDRSHIAAVYPGRPYTKWLLQTGTGLHETGSTFQLLLASRWDVTSGFHALVANHVSHDDLFIIKKSGTGTGRTEVHILTEDSGYKTFSLHTGTPLEQTGANFTFLIAPNRDLVALKLSGTGTGTTEVHILSAASNYQSFILQTGTGLEETSVDVFSFGMASNRDIFAIKKVNTGSGRTEVHVLRAADNYQTFSLHISTPLHETPALGAFCVDANRDVYFIKKHGTGTNSSEVHVLSAASNYQSFSLHRGTILHETGDNFEFQLGKNRRLFAFKKYGTGTGSTEVHVLSRDEGMSPNPSPCAQQ